MNHGVYFHERLAATDCPAGVTVSRRKELPPGDFVIDEFSWGDLTLWFVAADDFTADERQAIYESAYSEAQQ